MQTTRTDNWFRGQLHTHSYWSDGRGFPEQTIEAYRQRGYAFMCLSDHNRFADAPDEWRPIVAEEGNWPPKISQAIFDDYLGAFGADWVETRDDGSGRQVRLKTYPELKARFDQPGRFLLLPGTEVTQKLSSGLQLHMNYIDVTGLIPGIQGAAMVQKLTTDETTDVMITRNTDQVEQLAKEQQRPHMMMLNHPFWFYCDIVPQDVIGCAGVRFFEICHPGSQYPAHPNAVGYTPEQFWDVVNAFRCVQGLPLIHGVGSDDSHFFDKERIDGDNGVGDAWIMVRAAELTPEHLLAAMHDGDFYTTNGVTLDDVRFTPADGTLRVKVQAEPGVQYQIHFITTKRDFDRTVTMVSCPGEVKKRPDRVLPLYSADIGRTARVVNGIEGSYTLEPDDLYVRARVESDRPCRVFRNFHPTVEMAWTQAF